MVCWCVDLGLYGPTPKAEDISSVAISQSILFLGKQSKLLTSNKCQHFASILQVLSVEGEYNANMPVICRDCIKG